MPMREKMPESTPRPAPYMQSMAYFCRAAGDPLEVGEDRDGLDIGAEKVSLRNGGRWTRPRAALAQVAFDRCHDGRAARSAIAGFEFHPIPLAGIVAGGDHHPAGRAQMLYRVGESRCRGDAIGDAHRDAGRGGHFGDDLRKALRHESSVVADAEAARRILVLANIVGDGSGREAHVFIGEVVGENSPPAIRAEMNGLLVSNQFVVLSGELADYAAYILRTLPGGDQNGVFGFHDHQVIHPDQRDKFLRAVDVIVARIDAHHALRLGDVAILRVALRQLMFVEGIPGTQVVPAELRRQAVDIRMVLALGRARLEHGVIDADVFAFG